MGCCARGSSHPHISLPSHTDPSPPLSQPLAAVSHSPLATHRQTVLILFFEHPDHLKSR